jgi:hypothetical protein
MKQVALGVRQGAPARRLAHSIAGPGPAIPRDRCGARHPLSRLDIARLDPIAFWHVTRCW